jgi:predicted transcriptional regulator
LLSCRLPRRDQPVAFDVAGGGLQRRGAGERGEMALGGKPRRVVDDADDRGGADVADASQASRTPPTRAASHRVPYGGMSASQRLNITLDNERAAKLSQLAARVHVNEGTLARSLLASAIDEADPDPANVVALLDAIPGAYDRTRHGLEQAAQGRTIPLDDL